MELGWAESSIRAAGRTDAGVHARGQVISFRLDWSAAPEKLTSALNAHLPNDIAVKRSEVVPAEFQPRFSATGRRYAYSLLMDQQRDPLRERFSWRVWPVPDLSRLREVSGLFVGKRDFGAFGRAPIPDGHTVRTIVVADWTEHGSELRLILEADAFLYRMVRRIVGACLQVARGEREISDLEASLAGPERKWEGKLAPAHGLCLEAVYYASGRSTGRDEE